MTSLSTLCAVVSATGAAILVAAGISLAKPSQESSSEPLPPLWRLVQQLAGENGFAADLGIIQDDMRAVAERMPRGGYRRVARALAEPWAIPEISEELARTLEGPFSTGRAVGFGTLIEGVSGLLDLEEPAKQEPGGQEDLLQDLTDESVIDEELLEVMASLLEKAADTVREGNRGLGDEKVQTLAADLVKYTQIDFKGHDPEAALTAAEKTWRDGFAKTLQACSLAGPVRAARLLSPLLEAPFLAGLAKRLADLEKTDVDRELCEGDVVAVLDWGETGQVIVGGRGKTHYKAPFALIIDLGGNDTYDSAAVSNAADRPVSVVIDLKGNDTYLGAESGPVHACGSISLLVDLDGKDHYQGGALGAASGGAGGLALLLDLNGDDVYQSRGYSQGFGLCGVGLLYDRAGDDRYDGGFYAQGATQGWGLGALVDWRGDDSYLADGVCPDTYGNSGPNIYHGGSQGNSMGPRHLMIPGGFGVLIDHQGKDRYQAGNFSQGGGYFYAFGLMLDEEGNDEYHGCRYSQGYGVHQAVGVRWDRAGNDKYLCRSVANAGCCWDEGVGYLIDDQGNDTYQVGGLALAASANTGFAFLIDRAGSDSYKSNGVDSQGGSGDASYHDKPSLALLLDLGRGRDSFSRPHRKDGIITCQPWWGICLDARERSIEDLLKRKKGRLRGRKIEGRAPPEKKGDG